MSLHLKQMNKMCMIDKIQKNKKRELETNKKKHFFGNANDG